MMSPRNTETTPLSPMTEEALTHLRDRFEPLVSHCPSRQSKRLI